MKLLTKVAGMEVVASGSNSNGEWVKYSNGTMICYRTWDFNTTTGGNKTGQLYYVDIDIRCSFAKPFISQPSVSFEVFNNNTAFAWLANGNRNIVVSNEGIGSSLRLLSAEDRALRVEMDIIAIGKWK